ncbi:hypothetical protein [Pirellulimonas nuda]|nr:hypothetical protein [Pirellulimonas nuda]
MTRPIRAQEEADAWVAELKEWVANRPGVDHFVDDSRESIYQGRGE